MDRDKSHINSSFLGQFSSKKHGFKVPENYFDGIEDTVISELGLNKIQPKNISSSFKTPTNYFNTVEDITITKLKAEVVFSKNKSEISDDYFSNIEDRVFAKIKEDKKVISIKRVTKYFAPLAIAASLLLIFILNSNQQGIVTFDSLATTEIEEFIENGLVDINTENLELAFSDIELATSSISTSISDDEVFEYLAIEDLENIIIE